MSTSKEPPITNTNPPANANANDNAITSTSTTTAVMELAAEETTVVNALQKRYQGLINLRARGLKGKGAWYWTHLEPTLLQSEDGLAKAVKLRCLLCLALFSASNPSRTASEHLKRGSCPNYTSPELGPANNDLTAGHATPPQPISSLPPPTTSSRKRRSYHVDPITMVDPTAASAAVVTTAVAADVAVYSSSSTPPPPPQHFALSGGKEDLNNLAAFENRVKKLKNQVTHVGPTVSQAQADAAFSHLADWFYESSGSVSFSSVDHPKFRAFLAQLGCPPFSRKELAGARLDARHDEARVDSDIRISDASFFQIAADGWSSPESDALVSLAVNLPNGTTVFRKVVHTPCHVPPEYVEEILWATLTEICRGELDRCAGIVADKFRSKALKSLESQNQLMVNLSCQLQAFRKLIRDLFESDQIPLFATVTGNCYKLANFFNGDAKTRMAFHKFQLEESDRPLLLRSLLNPPDTDDADSDSTDAIFGMIEDVVSLARPIQLTAHCDLFKRDDPIVRELGEMIRARGFWNEIEAVHSLVKLIKDMIREMEVERPLVSQCLPIWEDFRMKVKQWGTKFNMDEESVMKVVEKRFRSSYHPAWAAAFVLDPFYLVKDTSGKYLPPFKYLTAGQEKDVDKLIMRLVPQDEAHIVLMELMKWRSEGLDPTYAQAVQLKQVDPKNGKMKVVNRQSSRLVWEARLREEFSYLPKVAGRLLFLHATSGGGYKCNSSMLRWVRKHGRSRAAMDRAQKMMFVAAHAKLERMDFSNDEDKDAELFANGEDGATNQGFVDSPPV